MAAVYWSRTTSLNGYSSWGGDDNLTDTPDSYHAQQSQVYCPATDTIVSTRITMDPSWYLSLVLAIQPVLPTLLFLISLTFYQMPLDWWVRHHCRRGRCDGRKFPSSCEAPLRARGDANHSLGIRRGSALRRLGISLVGPRTMRDAGACAGISKAEGLEIGRRGFFIREGGWRVRDGSV